DRDIVGQNDAKRAVAVALRNRWRRRQLPEELRSQVTPKNILLIGPTGVGKTEIARRLARLVGAPFVKVEATKYTEVGYYGLDAGEMEDREVEVTLPGRSVAPVSILGAGNLDQMEMDLQGMFEKIMPKASQSRRMSVGEARPILLAQETEALIDPEKVNQAAV